MWLNTEKIADLFEIERSVITKHINNIYEDDELNENSTCAFFAHMGKTGQKYQTKYDNFNRF